MSPKIKPAHAPIYDQGSGFAQEEKFYMEELQLAWRNRAMPLEGLRYPITPTGLHFLNVHFDIPEVDIEKWSLTLGGLASNPLRLTLDDILKRPAVTTTVTMECAGNGRAFLSPRRISVPWLNEAIGTAEWTGTPLRGLLEEAGVSDKAVEVLFTGLDQGIQGEELQYFQRSLSVADAMRKEVLLAYNMNGAPLQPQHGYPLRLIVPGWYGMASVKWLERIELISEAFSGYQQAQAYRYRQSADEPGEPVSLIKVRALMVPPGVPENMTRTRLMQAGTVKLIGRAWAGRLGITHVEISQDGGSSWAEAQVDEAVNPFAWRSWSFIWEATPGRYTLCVRATDTEGNVQPIAQPWNYQGMGNNMAQRVDVIVE